MCSGMSDCWVGFAHSCGFTIPTEETSSMIVNGIRYDELPVVHIKSTKNNTIMNVTDHTGMIHLDIVSHVTQ